MKVRTVNYTTDLLVYTVHYGKEWQPGLKADAQALGGLFGGMQHTIQSTLPTQN